MQHKFHSISLLALSFSSLIHAGDFAPHLEALTEAPAPAKSSSFGDAFKNIGKIYNNPDNPYLQSFALNGRVQYQAALLDGNDVNGVDFNDNYDELRRFRVGAKAKFLKYFDASVSINLASDNRPRGGNGDLDFGYEGLDLAVLGFDIKKAFAVQSLDKLHLSYGVHKFAIGYEANTSSKKILTPERSGISNKVYGSRRPTGFKLKAAANDWNLLFGLYSTEERPEFDAQWDEGLAYQIGAGYQVSDELKISADFIYNGSDLGEENEWDYSWASSLYADYDAGPWGIIAEIIYGDNGDADNGVTDANRQGQFWGTTATSYYWLIHKKLQLVGQYQYAGSSESEGIRTSSRYIRRGHTAGIDVNSGRGDEHHSLYAGLNYHFLGHNSKIMTGIQYDDLSTPAGGVDATTLWLAYRAYF